MRSNTIRAELRVWGLPETFKTNDLRYKNPIEKGIYWYHFSIHIRKRDFNQFGTCISCGRKINSWQEGDCGHYIAAGKCGIELLFDERNNNLECSQCNAWDETHLIGYRRGLDKRYGEGTADSLEERYFNYKDGGIVLQWPREKYIQLLLQIGVEKKSL